MVSKNRRENPHVNELQEVLTGEPDAVGHAEVSDTSEDTLRFDEGSQRAEELAKTLAADLEGVKILAQELRDEARDDNQELSAHEALQQAIAFVGLDGFGGYTEAELGYIVERAEHYTGDSAPQQVQETRVAAVESEPATQSVVEQPNSVEPTNDKLAASLQKLKEVGVGGLADEKPPRNVRVDAEPGATEPSTPEQTKDNEILANDLALKLDAVEDAVTGLLNDPNNKIGFSRARKEALRANGLHQHADLPFDTLDAVFKGARKIYYEKRDELKELTTKAVATVIAEDSTVYEAVNAAVGSAKREYAKVNKGTQGFKPGESIRSAVEALVRTGKFGKVKDGELGYLDDYVAARAWSIGQAKYRNNQPKVAKPTAEKGRNKPSAAEYAKQIEEAAQKIAPVLPEVMHALSVKKKELRAAAGNRFGKLWSSTRYTKLRSEFVRQGALDADAVVSNRQIDDILQKSREIRKNAREAQQDDTEPTAPKSAEAPRGTSSAEQKAELDTKIADIARQVAEYDQVLGPHIAAGRAKHRAEYFREHDNFDGWHASDALINTLEESGLLTEQDLEGLDDRARRKLGGKIRSNIKQARKDYKENIAKIDEDAVKKWIETDAADKMAKTDPGAFNAIVNEKYEAFKANNPDANPVLFRFDIAKKEALEELGVINSFDAQTLTADHIDALLKIGVARHSGTEVQPTGTNEAGSGAPETNAQKIRELEESIAALRQQYGNLPDKNVPKGQQIVAEIRTLQAEIASLEALDQQQIDDAFNSLADKLDLKQQGDNTIEEPGDEELKALLAELSVDELNTRYESLEAKLQTLDVASDEVNELRKQLSDIYEVKAKKELAEAGQNGTTVETLQAEAADLQRQYAAIPDGERNSDQAKELQAKIIEKLNGVYEKLEEEYNAIPHESKRRTGDNLTPEQEQLAVRADELRKRLSDVYAEIAKAKLGEIVAPPTAEEQQRAQREREIRAAAETRIRDEAFAKYERVYRTALDEYAKLRAENEQKAEGLFPGIGRKKREVALSEAREKLQNAKLEYERFIVTAKREAGLYEGDEAAIAAAQSNELFEGLLSLDEQARTETLKIHEERAENRNKFQKFFVGVGKFLSKGNRFIRAAKTMGIGLATGAAVKGGLGAIAGSTLPVSLAAGGIVAGASLGVRYGVTQHNLDISRAEEAADKNAEGVVSRRLSDEQIAKLKTVLEGATAADIKQRQSTLAGNVLQESETNSKKKIDEARKKAGRTATMFGLSAAAGGIGAHIAQNGLPDIFSGHDAQAKPGDTPTKPGDPTGQNVPHDVEGRRQALEELKNAEKTGGGLDAKAELNLKGNSFFVESGNGPIREIQQAAKLNGHDISIGRAEEIYDKLYDKYGDKLVSGGPEYHGPNGDLRFGESGKYKWGNGVLEKIVTMAAK